MIINSNCQYKSNQIVTEVKGNFLAEATLTVPSAIPVHTTCTHQLHCNHTTTITAHELNAAAITTPP